MKYDIKKTIDIKTLFKVLSLTLKSVISNNLDI